MPDQSSDNVVLLVEDSDVVLETLRVKLANSGFLVISDSTGADAVELALEEHPKLVLLDINLPERDGISILSDLKRDSRTRSIPVLMLTNLTDQNLVTQAVELGAGSYIVKSEMSFDDVLKKVEDITRK